MRWRKTSKMCGAERGVVSFQVSFETPFLRVEMRAERQLSKRCLARCLSCPPCCGSCLSCCFPSMWGWLYGLCFSFLHTPRGPSVRRILLANGGQAGRQRCNRLAFSCTHPLVCAPLAFIFTNHILSPSLPSLFPIYCLSLLSSCRQN